MGTLLPFPYRTAHYLYRNRPFWHEEASHIGPAQIWILRQSFAPWEVIEVLPLGGQPTYYRLASLNHRTEKPDTRMVSVQQMRLLYIRLDRIGRLISPRRKPLPAAVTFQFPNRRLA